MVGLVILSELVLLVLSPSVFLNVGVDLLDDFLLNFFLFEPSFPDDIRGCPRC